MVDVTHCPHENTDLVIPRGMQRAIAKICTDCLTQLPLDWGCPDCEWVEIQELSGRILSVGPTLLCNDHHYLEGTA